MLKRFLPWEQKGLEIKNLYEMNDTSVATIVRVDIQQGLTMKAVAPLCIYDDDSIFFLTSGYLLLEIRFLCSHDETLAAQTDAIYFTLSKIFQFFGQEKIKRMRYE